MTTVSSTVSGRIVLENHTTGTNNTLQAAGIPRLYAPTIGISVDARRQNLSEESLAANVERLKAYTSRLILFPKKSNKPKKTDSSKEELKAVSDAAPSNRAAFPIAPVDLKAAVSEIKKSDVPAPVEGGAFRKLRDERANKRNLGQREKRAKEKADAEAAKNK